VDHQRDAGVTRKQVGLVLDTVPLERPNTDFWPILKDASRIGKVTSAVYSPRLGKNIALAMVDAEQAEIGNSVQVLVGNLLVTSEVVERPFYDAKKSLAIGKGQVA
jgi:glycine cleavage system aminomethyltransferase T